MKILRHICFVLFLTSLFLDCSQDRIVPIMSYADSVRKAQDSYKNEPFVEANQIQEPPNVVQELIDSGKIDEAPKNITYTTVELGGSVTDEGGGPVSPMVYYQEFG